MGSVLGPHAVLAFVHAELTAPALRIMRSPHLLDGQACLSSSAVVRGYRRRGQPRKETRGRGIDSHSKYPSCHGASSVRTAAGLTAGATVAEDRCRVLREQGTSDMKPRHRALLAHAPAADLGRSGTGRLADRNSAADSDEARLSARVTKVATTGRPTHFRCSMLHAISWNFSLTVYLRLWYDWVIASIGPWVAAQDSGESHPAPSQYAKALDSFIRVL